MPDKLTVSLKPQHIQNTDIHCVGAKGTGMCALCEILVGMGARVEGSDIDETFYTDTILEEIGVRVQPFDRAHLSEKCRLVIRSAAYGDENPIVAAAALRRIPIITYPEALGMLSAHHDASAIAGVHGKTTTTAITGTLIKAHALPATVIAGSAVADFGNRCTWQGGNQFLIAETCEYRRHFMAYHPRRIVLTSVETDHQDFYPDYASIRDAFLAFVLSLPMGGELIYCADDAGAREVALMAEKQRRDIRLIPYGESAEGSWKLQYSRSAAGLNGFSVQRFPEEFHLRIPGRHIALDALAALVLTERIYPDMNPHLLRRALKSFRGSRRRSEIIGEVNNILVMDDYAHHPTAIAATLQGLKEFHPQRRLVVDFMPHTYSRSSALLEEFAQCFSDADILILHPIYASAREKFDGKITGIDLQKHASAKRPGQPTVYSNSFPEAVSFLKKTLRPGDLFITLGAGNNWEIGRKIMESLND